MGYTITIGQLEIRKSPEDGLDCECISFGAEGVTSQDAPAFGELTDYTNSRWPSYSAWSDFLREFGLWDVFYHHPGHLIGDHPGVRLVTPGLVAVVRKAKEDYTVANPDAVAGFGEGQDSKLPRIIWLEYWLEWALENCETPVIANS